MRKMYRTSFAPSAGGEGNESYIVKTVLRKNEAMLTAEEELV